MPRHKSENAVYLFEHIDQKLADRFWSKVDMSDDCWLWTGGSTKKGYGNFSVGPASSRKLFMAHRVALALGGEVDITGMDVCHHCDNPSCVRPEHLFIGTRHDNMTDMVTKGRSTRRATCKRGHLFTEENTWWYFPSNPAARAPNGVRLCKACRKRGDAS